MKTYLLERAPYGSLYIEYQYSSEGATLDRSDISSILRAQMEDARLAYRKISFPADLAKQIEAWIEQGGLGFRNLAEFVITASRERLLALTNPEGEKDEKVKKVP